jgi:hypothetical protein
VSFQVLSFHFIHSHAPGGQNSNSFFITVDVDDNEGDEAMSDERSANIKQGTRVPSPQHQASSSQCLNAARRLPSPPRRKHCSLPRLHCMGTTGMHPASNIFPTMIWRPQFLNESVDDKPLATTISGLFHEFPYDRLPTDAAVAIWMRPGFVLSAIVFYLVSIPLLRFVTEKIGGGGYGISKTNSFRNFVAAHNLALAIFSGVCGWNVWLIALDNLARRGMLYCHDWKVLFSFAAT